MKVITISGKAESGKDLSASILTEALESKGKKVLIIHYADYLKFICQKYFDWDGTKSEEGRSILQKVGTNIIRKEVPTFWVDQVCSLIKVIGKLYDIVIIPDCRFPNEVYLMKTHFETISLHITRLNYENSLTPQQRLHPSEIALDGFTFDHYISSETGIDYLKVPVKRFITHYAL